ncbi:hypothetical protein ACFQIC_02710 [Halobacillus seohaensis]|uniref:Uncharacterized protein n=1 Tax=Halobacillus seohaensis TaxID=447421 RepID=A0ABW2EEM8_9BACI
MARLQHYRMQWKVSNERKDKRTGVRRPGGRSEYMKSLMEEARFKDE